MISYSKKNLLGVERNIILMPEEIKEDSDLLKSLLKESIKLIQLVREQPRSEERLKYLNDLEKKKKEELEKLERGEIEIDETGLYCL